MKIIRTLWGARHTGEIERATQISREFGLLPEDQLVYCWDQDNLDFVEKLGYKKADYLVSVLPNAKKHFEQITQQKIKFKYI